MVKQALGRDINLHVTGIRAAAAAAVIMAAKQAMVDSAAAAEDHPTAAVKLVELAGFWAAVAQVQPTAEQRSQVAVGALDTLPVARLLFGFYTKEQL